MDDSSQVQFMTSLVKSIQAVCHGHVDFLAKVEVRGHLVVSVDSSEEFDYVLNEKVCRNPRESSLKFVSKSFHAEPPKKPKPTTEAGCSTEDKFSDSPNPDGPPVFSAAESDVPLMQEDLTVEPEPISPKSSPRPPSPCLHSSSNTSGAEKRLPTSEALPPLHSVTFSEVSDRNFSHSFSIPPLQEPGHASTALPEGIGVPPRLGQLPPHQPSGGLSRPSNPKRARTLSHPHTDTSSSFSPASIGDAIASESQTIHRESKDATEPSHRKQPQRSRGSEREDLPVDIDLTLVKQEIEEAAQGLCLDSSDSAPFHQPQPTTSSSAMTDLYQWNLPVHFQQSNGADVGGSNIPSFHNPSLSDPGRLPGDLPMDSSLYPVMLHGASRPAGQDPGPNIGPPPSMPGPSQGFPRGPPGEGGSGVRPGKVAPDVAQTNNMVELTPGSGVYLYPHMLHRARFRQSGTSCANYLLKCFYTTGELLGSNLTGVNNKKLLDPQIIASIIEFSRFMHPGISEAAIKRGIRCRITSMETIHKHRNARYVSTVWTSKARLSARPESVRKFSKFS